jgi:hypothetical protein
MMGMNDMMDRCMDMMDSTIGGGMMGNGVMLIVLLAVLLLLWAIGLAAVGALIFWGVRSLSRPHA